MTKYRVSYEVDVEDDSFEQASLQAAVMLKDQLTNKECLPVIFNVYETHQNVVFDSITLEVTVDQILTKEKENLETL